MNSRARTVIEGSANARFAAMRLLLQSPATQVLPFLVGAVLATSQSTLAATIIVDHIGSADPTSEGWDVIPGSPDVTGGGIETTASGAHEFWQINHTTGTVPGLVSFDLTLDQLDFDWRVEGSLRVVNSENHCCFPALLPFTELGVRDGLDIWVVQL